MPADAPPLIDDDLRAFVHGPVSAFLGTADAIGTPDATRVAGIVAVDDRHLRVLIASDATTARRNATVGASVAVLVTDITTYRSVQWKGAVTECGGARSSGDVVLVDQHLRRFAEASPVVGLDPADTWRFFPVDVVPVVVELTEMFDQTPGPGAGKPLAVRP